MGTNEVRLHCAKPIKALNSKFHDHGGDYEVQNKGISLHELLYYLCATRPLHASVCMCMQYFESHHEFVLVVTIREFFRYLVDIFVVMA